MPTANDHNACCRKTGPFIVPVFIPQSGCVNRCVFCNQKAVTGTNLSEPGIEKIKQDIRSFLRYRRSSRLKTEISFYGGNFLGQKHDTVIGLLEAATEFVRSGHADGIRFSTRPDTVDEPRMDILSTYPVSTVELGVQSMDDRLLALSKRGHSSKDTTRAVSLLKQRGYETGLQMMVGLPGEDKASAIRTGHRIASLEPNFVRIYPTLVIRGSLLEKWYASARYEPLDLARCTDIVKELVLLFSKKGIPVIRIGLQANESLDSRKDLVAGPYHPAMGQMVMSEIFFEKAAACITSAGKDFSAGINLIVHPKMISTMRGQKNINIYRLNKAFAGIGPIRVIVDHDACETDVRVDFRL